MYTRVLYKMLEMPWTESLINSLVLRKIKTNRLLYINQKEIIVNCGKIIKKKHLGKSGIHRSHRS